MAVVTITWRRRLRTRGVTVRTDFPGELALRIEQNSADPACDTWVADTPHGGIYVPSQHVTRLEITY